MAKDIPIQDKKGIRLQSVAGPLNQNTASKPTPDSWAADAANEVAILSIELAANSQWLIPACSAGVNRSLYFFAGDKLKMDDQIMHEHAAFEINEAALTLQSFEQPVRVLLLQGRPINEPVAQYGPFVMNTQSEIQQAMSDYQHHQYGGWPWTSTEPVHEKAAGRFSSQPTIDDKIPQH